MKIFRIKHKDDVFYATIGEGKVFKSLSPRTSGIDEAPFSECILLPVAIPSKIVCVGLNYKEHARELNMKIADEPMIFLKPPSAVIGDYANIILPSVSSQVDYEGELAVIIGRSTKNIRPENAAKHVFGYTCANDITARDFQKKDTLFTRAKGFDTFAPVGPCIETALDTRDLAIKTIVNNKVCQEGNTSDMIYSPAELVSFISSIMTLAPGDVILTGTPPGIGPLKADDTVEVEIHGIGKLTNVVIEETDPQVPVH